MSTAPISSSRPPILSLPLHLSWGGHASPIPVREVRITGSLPKRPTGLDAPPWWDSGPSGEPFHFSAQMAELCADIGARVPEFGHLDLSRLLITFSQARNARPHGLQARVTPMRFGGGQLRRRHSGVEFQVQRYFVEMREILYVMSFCLPRFLDQTFEEKLVTVFHELYHISPNFDGDLRRHAGRYAIHTASQRRYDEHMAELAREYMMTRPEPRAVSFLRMNFAQLCHRHGRVIAHAVPRPKLIPLSAARTRVPRKQGNNSGQAPADTPEASGSHSAPK